VDSAVIRAALELLDEHGYDGLTMEGVAARAGVAKTTLYRRLPSRLDLIAEVARQVAAPVREHDTGDLRADLVALLQDVIGVLHEPMIRRVLPRLLAEAREREELAAILRGFWTERRRRRSDSSSVRRGGESWRRRWTWSWPRTRSTARSTTAIS
jgi:AcrR family transcriptional regulator